ncbi:MAG: Cell division cycle protein 48 [Promethearchaeota archaeon]|jgi:transitional endoplasmic reticulum ATPase|nr:MAG: Cell division cycle protein 48 [Candidatus Lokiarchaeota archaeon]
MTASDSNDDEKKEEQEEEGKQLRVQKAKKRDIGRNIIRIDPKTMEELGIQTGDVIAIEGKKQSAGISWPSYPQDNGLGIVRIDSRLRKNTGTSIDDTVKIKKVDADVAQNIVLAPASVKIRSNPRFETFVKRKLNNYPVTIDDIILISIGISREITFKVINLRPKGICIIKQDETNLTISEHVTEEEEKGGMYVTYEDVGGLDKEIQRVREMVELPLRHPSLFKRLGIDPPKGVLLRGPPGCGKTLLARAVANESEAHFISINGPEVMSKFYGESEKKLRKIFIEAEEKSPSIIFIDEIDAIAPKRETVTGEVERRVVAQLLALMDGLHSRGRVIVIGATNRPNSLDPALRRPGRFDREIEIKVPNEKGRKEIFQIHTRNMPLDDKKQLIKEFSQITHGFVGADISAVCREAAMSALRRYLPKIDLESEIVDPELLEQIRVTREDFDEAMKEVLPSGIREVFVEIPNVNWGDVGGLEDLKQKLIEAVDWPLSNPKIFKRMGINPPKGILLYGPPGCGKTLLARAVASESKANFISVKGPELLSKWVGESEKAIREVFRKAKMAAPCIIFFDEFDSIAPSRGRYTTDSGVTEKVLSQFLTELDGLEVMKDVVVIAATNRPDILDTALIRPGRIDRVLYVPSPDQKERLEILKIFTEEMPLSTNVDLEKLIKMTDGFSGADIETWCREAAMKALRENIRARKVSIEHFEEAHGEIHPTITPDITKWYEEFGKKLKRRKIETKKGEGLFV